MSASKDLSPVTQNIFDQGRTRECMFFQTWCGFYSCRHRTWNKAKPLLLDGAICALLITGISLIGTTITHTTSALHSTADPLQNVIKSVEKGTTELLQRHQL